LSLDPPGSLPWQQREEKSPQPHVGRGLGFSTMLRNQSPLLLVVARMTNERTVLTFTCTG
jgi:hypothetical protein